MLQGWHAVSGWHALCSMSAIPEAQELHQLIDRLDAPEAKRVLRLVKSALTEPEITTERPWPESIGAFHTGLSDLAANPETYFGDDFGR